MCARQSSAGDDRSLAEAHEYGRWRSIDTPLRINFSSASGQYRARQAIALLDDDRARDQCAGQCAEMQHNTAHGLARY